MESSVQASEKAPPETNPPPQNAPFGCFDNSPLNDREAERLCLWMVHRLAVRPGEHLWTGIELAEFFASSKGPRPSWESQEGLQLANTIKQTALLLKLATFGWIVGEGSWVFFTKKFLEFAGPILEKHGFDL